MSVSSNKMTPKLNPVPKNELEKYYISEKLSLTKISKKCNISRSTIDRWLHFYNIPIRSLSEAMSGRIATEETRKILSLAQMGRKHPEEVKKKIGKAHKGKIVSEKTKEKMRTSRSSEERSASVRGNKHPNWQGGKSSLHVKIRNTLEYKQWRKNCYNRDSYTCQICSIKGCKLNVDHIKAMSQIVVDNDITSVEEALICKEFWNLNNGRTLCVDCHKKTDTYGGKRKLKHLNK